MPQYQGIWTLAQAAQLQSTQRWVTDPLYRNTTLLLQADNAANGAQNNTFLDSSSNNFTITRNGNTTQGTFTPYSLQPGAWSNYFDGTGDSLTLPINAAFAMGTGTFTIEFWFYTSNVAQLGYIIQTDVASTALYVSFSSSTLRLTDQNTTYVTTPTLVSNTWYHIAVVRSGTGSNQTVIYTNGVAGTAGTCAQNFTQAGPLVGANGYIGYISNLRIVKGSAVYTTGFTPPTAPLTNITNTLLLTCQSNRFVDNGTANSGSGFSITPNGDVSVQAFSPFAPQYQYTPSVTGGSGYFDGSGDYLSEASNAAFDLGGGNFTVEAFIYMTAGSGAKRAVVSRHNSGSNAIWDLYVDTDNKVYFAVWTSGVTATQVIATDATIPLNQWVHVAGGINGTNLYVCANGVYKSATLTITPASSPSSAIGVTQGMNGNGSSFPFTGYISGVRVLKGTAQYTANPYTIPTAPLTAIANTSLLCNFTNAGIYDGTLKNNLETVGNAQVSTSVVKYGTGSMYFDGTGDNLAVPMTETLKIPANSPFTVEGWFYLTAAQANYRMILSDNAATPTYISINSTGLEVQFGAVPGTIASITQTFNQNTWYHIAVVRSINNVVSIYIDGVARTVTNPTQSAAFLYQGTTLWVGRFGTTPAYEFFGYMDDLRITKGIARYTANFTPPTVALPRQ